MTDMTAAKLFVHLPGVLLNVDPTGLNSVDFWGLLFRVAHDATPSIRSTLLLLLTDTYRMDSTRPVKLRFVVMEYVEWPGPVLQEHTVLVPMNNAGFPWWPLLFTVND